MVQTAQIAAKLGDEDFRRLGVRPSECRLWVIRMAATRSTGSLAEEALRGRSPESEFQLWRVATSTYRLLDPRQRVDGGQRAYIGRILPLTLWEAGNSRFTGTPFHRRRAVSENRDAEPSRQMLVGDSDEPESVAEMPVIITDGHRWKSSLHADDLLDRRRRGVGLGRAGFGRRRGRRNAARTRAAWWLGGIALAFVAAAGSWAFWPRKPPTGVVESAGFGDSTGLTANSQRVNPSPDSPKPPRVVVDRSADPKAADRNSVPTPLASSGIAFNAAGGGSTVRREPVGPRPESRTQSAERAAGELAGADLPAGDSIESESPAIVASAAPFSGPGGGEGASGRDTVPADPLATAPPHRASEGSAATAGAAGKSLPGEGGDYLPDPFSQLDDPVGSASALATGTAGSPAAPSLRPSGSSSAQADGTDRGRGERPSAADVSVPRVAAPSRRELAAARAKLRDLLPGSSRVSSDSAASAVPRLERAAEDESSGSVGQYAALLSTIELAWLCEPWRQVETRAAAINRVYEIDAQDLLAEAFVVAQEHADGAESHRHLAEQGWVFAERLLRDERLESARRMTQSLAASARVLGDRHALALVAETHDAISWMDRVRESVRAAESGQAGGGDADARARRLGRYRGLMCRQWPRAIDFLAAAPDVRLASLASRESALANTVSPDSWIRLALQWNGFAEKLSGRAAESIRLHAITLLELAEDEAVALDRLEIRRRVEEIEGRINPVSLRVFRDLEGRGSWTVPAASPVSD